MFHSTHHIMKNSSHIDVYQLVTNLIIEKLDQGIIPWRKPWNDYGPAVNYISKKPYRGINQLILNGLHIKPFYLTFKQAAGLSGSIRKGARSIPVTYWNVTYRNKETNRSISHDRVSSYPAELIQKTAFLKYYRVFNVDDVLHVKFDIQTLAPEVDHYSIDRCDKVLSEMMDCPEIRHKENQAYYHPVNDYINMPPLEHFKTSALFYSILFHELIHATGHHTRLNRFEGNEVSAFNSSTYSKEELTAEIGAAFLNSHTGILNDDTLTDSTAYIQGWLSKLRNDKKFIVEASAKAQKAVDYILNTGS